MTNLGQLRNNVRLLADVDATDVSDAEISRAIQYAYEEIIGDAAWPFLMKRLAFAGIVGQAEYVISAIDDADADLEAHRVKRVMTRGRVLQYVTPDIYFERNPFGNTASAQTISREWTILESENLALWPPPDTTDQIQMVYAKLAPALSVDNDVPLMPSRYHQILETGALAGVHKKIGDLETSEVYKKEFTDQVQTMSRELLRSQPAHPLIYGGAQRPGGLLTRAVWPWEY